MIQRVICIVFTILATINVNAAIEVSTYTNSHKESVNITLLVKNEKPYRLCIPCYTKSNSNGEIWIKLSDVSKFREALTSLKNKYEEWNFIAQENDVNDLKKEIPVKFPKVQFLWGRTTTFFGDGVFKADWVLKTPVQAVVCYAFIKASNNRFADESFDFRFYTPQDVQNLIDALSQDKIDAAIRKVDNANLFN